MPCSTSYHSTRTRAFPYHPWPSIATPSHAIPSHHRPTRVMPGQARLRHGNLGQTCPSRPLTLTNTHYREGTSLTHTTCRVAPSDVSVSGRRLHRAHETGRGKAPTSDNAIAPSANGQGGVPQAAADARREVRDAHVTATKGPKGRGPMKGIVPWCRSQRQVFARAHDLKRGPRWSNLCGVVARLQPRHIVGEGLDETR